MIDLVTFYGVRLPGGFVISTIETTHEVLTDALGREAVAQTVIRGKEFHLTIRHGLDDRELSITLYHEVLEAATVAALDPLKASLISMRATSNAWLTKCTQLWETRLQPR
jgi:hypothetical protein